MGNICRSPMAEVVTRDLLVSAGLDGEVSVESFGTTRYHAGSPMESLASRTLRSHGWHPGRHMARQIRPADLDRFDLILCADRPTLEAVNALGANRRGVRPQVALIRSYDPDAPEAAEVPDPYNQGPEAFDLSLSTIEPACRALVTALGAST
jgi:protein-tyrosine phosphatase